MSGALRAWLLALVGSEAAAVRGVQEAVGALVAPLMQAAEEPNPSLNPNLNPNPSPNPDPDQIKLTSLDVQRRFKVLQACDLLVRGLGLGLG